MLFGPFGWLLNLLFPINWILWDWSSWIWNLICYFFIVPIISIIVALIFGIIGVPLTIIALILLFILFIVVIIIDGPIFISGLFGVSFFSVAGVLTLLFGPFIAMIISIFIPFDQVFYLWIGIMIFVVVWEIVLPLFGFGLQQKEIEHIKGYEEDPNDLNNYGYY